jgi:hypothetical protein
VLIGEELHRLYYSALKADAGIAAITSRVFDKVPAGAVFPYISFGPVDAADDGADCIDGLEITQQLDIWSRKDNSLECKNLVELVRKALHERELELTDNAMVETRVFLTRVFRDPDGVTWRGVVQVTAHVEVT